jgi:hypothetical protein
MIRAARRDCATIQKRECSLPGEMESDYGTDLQVTVKRPDGGSLARALTIPQQHRILGGIGRQLAARAARACAQRRCYAIRIRHL